jgi:hypothetical protein
MTPSPEAAVLTTPDGVRVRMAMLAVELRRADDHVAIKRGEAELKVLRSLIEDMVGQVTIEEVRQLRRELDELRSARTHDVVGYDMAPADDSPRGAPTH